MVPKKSFWLPGITLLSFFCVVHVASAQNWNPGHRIGTITGKYHFGYNQPPDQLVEIFPAAIPNTGLTYQWEQSTTPVTGFAAIPDATGSSYSIPGPLSQTSYYRRKSTSGFNFIYSNIIKISVVSVYWEDLNYVREHDVTIKDIAAWTDVDLMPIGSKLQTTTYLDGLGRSTQKISRETATPPNGVDLWGDMVQFSQYDGYGREPVSYLPYTTTSQTGKFKTSPLTGQPQYYVTNYNETSAFFSKTYDNSPLNRVMNVRKPGTSWASSIGVAGDYDLNASADNVQRFFVSYVQGSAPVNSGAYPANTLYKITATGEDGKKVVEYTDKSGRLILKKVQLDDNPGPAHSGWICIYNVYDDFGRLRYQIEPEGIKYLDLNGWSFAGTNGQQVLAEQVLQHNYDDKGRMIWKKTPGSAPLNMIYDVRDRVVFMQDGNQAAMATPQWTTEIYDVLDRQVITTLYNTTKTITQLKTDINNAPVSNNITITNPGTVSVTAITHLNPLSSADLNNSSVTTNLKYIFYDNYSFNAVKPFNTNYTNLSAYSPSDPNVMPIAKSLRTISNATGSMIRVLGTTTFLSATHYFDERGSHIQTLEENIKAGTDIITLQRHFDGRVMSSCTDHTAPGTEYINYKVLTKYIFDKLGRVSSIQKQFGTNAFKTIVSYEYDDAGRVKIKRLDPGYTAGGNADLESLVYSYNIHNQLTGINKDHALKTPANYNKWGHFFGLYLGFDNRDNIFASANLSGKATGVLWNTQGDDAQRRYNYTYDNAGRMVNASFTEKQHTGDSWSNSQVDFSITGTSSKITYDLNGNVLNMLHKGVLPGTPTPITIDNLNYTYASFSNKLETVSDQMNNANVNGKFGDFKDGTNGTGSYDYVYDANGNLVIDLNKNAKDLAGMVGANGIKYNYLDKPEEIRIAGKGTIKIVYSALGRKLQRLFIPEPSGATITTTYVKQYIYQETSGGGAATLQFINFEEGRIRVITPVSQVTSLDALIVDGNMDLPNGKRGAYDFYIMDYLGNIRMILTEETHIRSNTATMETDRATLEESIFGQTGVNNEVAVTRYNTPAAWQNGSLGAKVSRLGTNSGHNIGPNALQKVMAGDKVTATVQYYHQGVAGGNNTNFLSTVVSSLTQAISTGSAATTLVKDNATNITNQLSGVTGFVNAVQPGGSNPPGNTPQAYLTILFFDERFNFISAADGGVVQQQVAASVGSNGDVLGLMNIKAPKNGYVYAYISNQSNNDVYFDNLQMGITGGNIIEENHYYAYGLRIATLSSKKLGNSYEGNLKNNYLYQAAFSELDDDIGWNDFALRNYDAQIGRWVQQDPYLQSFSPYSGMGNDPINHTDPSGGIYIPPVGGLSTTAETAITLSEVVIRAVKPATTAAKAISPGLMTIRMTWQFANLGAKIINTSIATKQIGAISKAEEDPAITRLNALTKVLDEGTNRNNYTWKKLVEKNAKKTEVAMDLLGEKSDPTKITLGQEKIVGSNQSVTPCRCPDPKLSVLLGDAHYHPPYDDGSASPPSGEDIASLYKILDEKFSGNVKNASTPLYYSMIIDAGNIRYAIVITDPDKASEWLTYKNYNSNVAKFEDAFNEWASNFDAEFTKTIKTLYKDSGLSFYKTGPEKTNWVKIQ